MSHLLLAVGLVIGFLVVLVLAADLMVEEGARLSREPRHAKGDQDRS
jgi:Ca2+/Na+ antiporter